MKKTIRTKMGLSCDLNRSGTQFSGYFNRQSGQVTGPPGRQKSWDLERTTSWFETRKKLSVKKKRQSNSFMEFTKTEIMRKLWGKN